MDIDRRGFLKFSTAAVGGMLLGRGSQRPGADSRAMATVYDFFKCIGCRSCQVACKRWHKLPAEPGEPKGLYDQPLGLSATTWTVIELKKKEDGWFFTNRHCMHCTQASCEAVCPTGAISHQGEIVAIDQKWCIGCGYCVAACPFDVAHTDSPVEEKGTSRKCTFCLDRQAMGLIPACVEACPVEALVFGEREGLVAAAKQSVEFLRANGYPKANLYGEKELGGLYRMSILPFEPSVCGYPDLPRFAVANVLGQWLSGIVTAGVIALLPFWLLFRRREGMKKELSQGGEG